MEDVAKLNWPPVNKNIGKLTHKSLYDETFPEYLKLNLHKVSAYSLRPSIAPVLSIPRESETFQHSAATTFNKLPVAIRNITECNSFCRVFYMISIIIKCTVLFFTGKIFLSYSFPINALHQKLRM